MNPSVAPLAVTMGDPAGCGPQITIQTWQARNELALEPFFVIADPRLFDADIPVQTIKSPDDARTTFETALPVLPLHLDGFADLKIGAPSGTFARAILESIETATALSLSGAAGGVVTNPISKSVLYEEGFSFPGHTEFIASLCADKTSASPSPVMMLVGGGLRVALATIHIPLMHVRDHLRPDSLEQIVRITHQALKRDFGLSSPRLAFTGLNPHAGENGTIGKEEQEIINPVAQHLRDQGLSISDARPADTVFHEALTGQYDAVIAMTHDQGLIPVKTLDMWGGVNTTLGLPIIRTSPDHGTAYDAAASGTCRADSLIAAIRLASELRSHRAKANG